MSEAIEKIRAAVPAELVELPIWLVWKYEQGPDDNKPRKVPYYAKGVKRNGTMDSPQDRAELVTFDQAASAMTRIRAQGVGIALGRIPDGRVLSGLDFDNCYVGGILDERVLDVRLAAGSYSEKSPSGTGLHILGFGDIGTTKKDANGYEIYSGKRFFTFTGECVNGAGLADLTGAASLTRKLFGDAPHEGKANAGQREPRRFDRMTLAQIKAELATGIAPANYNDWLCETAALRTRLESLGETSDRYCDAWHAWSERSSGHVDCAMCSTIWNGWKREKAPINDVPWPKPTPLPEGLPPVPAFDPEILPPAFRRRAEDIADRMQCPLDFPAVALMVTLAGVVGRRCGVKPKQHDDWLVVPNLWGMAIGRPGIQKSPALEEALRPIRVLQDRSIARHALAMAEYEADELVREQAQRVAKDKIKAALKKHDLTAAEAIARQTVNDSPDSPTCERYIVNDSTVEKLGEILADNPNGVLVYRDELTGWFRTLERQGHEADRAFYLESWNGTGGYTYDRIGRGTLHIPAVCVSILGSIQPGPLSDLVRGLRGSGNDGLLQRFQLSVWPDSSRIWRNVDRRPDQEARDEVIRIIEGVAAACARVAARASESAPEQSADLPALHFDAAAQELFDAWRAELEKRLRETSLHPMLEAHLSKYRSLVPTLALLTHLADGASVSFGSLIPEDSVIRAIAWAEYLEPHAKRIYAPAISPAMDAARALAEKIKAREIDSCIALRDVYRNGWSGLATRDDAIAAVNVLVEYDWLRERQEQTPGRLKTFYETNPEVRTECP